MKMELITKCDANESVAHKIARTVYAETAGASLSAAEALTNMIANIAMMEKCDCASVAARDDIFGALNPTSVRHNRMHVSVTNRGFQMCLRVARRMLRGGLVDTVHGAIRFHHADEMPAWATARGYIADIDGLLFYL